MEDRIWYGKCVCGQIYECPDGLTPCCGVLTTLTHVKYDIPFDKLYMAAKGRIDISDITQKGTIPFSTKTFQEKI